MNDVTVTLYAENPAIGKAWSAIAQVAEQIAKSPACGTDEARAMCDAIDRLSAVIMGDDAIPMVLHCPKCGLQHIDAAETHGLDVGEAREDAPAEWKNPPHRSHLCHGCGHVWRPADVATTGVAAVKTKGKNDSPIAAESTQALRDVMAERRRQVEVEGWTPEHDDEHGDQSMAIAAACYVLANKPALEAQTVKVHVLWQWTGWSFAWFKPKDRRRNLVRATALTLAEIERHDRASARKL